MGAFESGQAFLAGVLAKLPTELQAQAKALFESPTAKDAVTLVGDGALARTDYSKAMDAIKTKDTELQERLATLNTWFADNEAALKEYVVIKPAYDALKGKGGAGGGTGDDDDKGKGTPPDPRKVVEEVLAQQGPEYIQVAAWLHDKGMEHFQLFGERLNTQEIVTNPKLGKPIAGQPGRVFSLVDAYNEKYGERVATKQQELTEQKYNAEVEKRVAAKLAAQTAQPFPLRGSQPSVLDVLETKDGAAAHTLDSAVAEYERLQAQRSPST